MRRFNAILTVLILVLFLLHGVFGALVLTGFSYNALKALARVCATLIIIHTAIGIKLTVDSILVWKKTGTPYLRENGIFWARRISGLAIMILIFFHMFAFGYMVDGVYHLKPYSAAKMTAQILFILSVALHVLTNVRPMLIALGARPLKRYVPQILVILSVIMLVFTAAFIFYYFYRNAGGGA